ncbi:TPA: RHS repeat-associated core domain-containing protein, partial [Elizabethkingia anophelis]
QSDGTLRRYSYQYDGVNRLKEGNYWDNAGAISGSYAERLNYDVNGNITGLQRTGLGAGVMDQLSYTYDQSGNSNKLIRVNDASGNAAGYPVGGNTIVYDINGNMVNHLDKGISNIAYNYLNLPSSITASMGNTDYVYRADGTKVRKVFGGKTTDYLDGFQYENGVLQFVPTSEGYYDVVKNKYIYNYTDHLGNVRLSYTKGASGGAEIIEENNYYPFGLKHQGYNSNSLANSAYQYKYNGKELQETGMYDYGARMYMPELGRWGVVDPLAEKYPLFSPYVYVANTPTNAIDPDGNYIIYVTKNGTQLQYRDGSFHYLNGKMKGKIYDGRTQSLSTSLFRLARAYRNIEHSGDKKLIGMLHKLEKSENTHVTIEQDGKSSEVTIFRKGSKANYEGDGTLTYYDFSAEAKKSFQDSEGVPDSDLSIVTHEMQHQYDYDINNMGDTQYKTGQTAESPGEQRAVKTENRARAIEGLPERTTYGGKKINSNPKNYILPNSLLLKGRNDKKESNY